MNVHEFYEVRTNINSLIRFCRKNEAYQNYEGNLLSMEEQLYKDQGYPSPMEETARLVERTEREG